MSKVSNVGTAATVEKKSLFSVSRIARLAVGAALLHVGAGAATAAVGIIDTFEDADLSEYTLTKVLDSGTGVSNISFATTGGKLSVSSAGTTGAEQVLFLRDDRPLGVGEMLLADIPAGTGSAPSYDRDFGIAVGASETPLGVSGAGDSRENFVEISRRSANEINFFAFRERGPTGTFPGAFTTTNVFVARDNTPAISLFIARPTATTFEAGFILPDGIRRVTGTTTYTAAVVPGAAVGFYSDLRFSGTAPVLFDNLRISVIPEPTSLAALAVGGLLVARRRRGTADAQA